MTPDVPGFGGTPFWIVLIKVVGVTEIATTGIAGDCFQSIMRGESLEGLTAQCPIGINAEMHSTVLIASAETGISQAARHESARVDRIGGDVGVVQEVDRPADLISVVSFGFHGAGRISHNRKREPGGKP